MSHVLSRHLSRNFLSNNEEGVRRGRGKAKDNLRVLAPFFKAEPLVDWPVWMCNNFMALVLQFVFLAAVTKHIILAALGNLNFN